MEGELGSVNINLDEHARQDQMARISGATVAEMIGTPRRQAQWNVFATSLFGSLADLLFMELFGEISNSFYAIEHFRSTCQHANAQGGT